jgi:hypothetical protein
MPVWFWPFLGLLIGAALRTFLPYVVAAFEAVRDAESWSAWPPFKPSYLIAFLVACLGFGVAFVTVPGALVGFLSWDFFAAVALAYTGQDIGRQIVKVAQAL